MLFFDISGAQIDGARDYQEDAFLITHLGDSDSEGGSMVIVADGMGGHAAGNVASNMAVQTFNKHVTTNFPNENLADVLRESVQQANNSISETVRETAGLRGMGCTLVAAVMVGKFIRWVSVGDSHLYLIRNHELKKNNADHSYGGFLERMAAEGNPVEAEAGFSRNMLISALTGEDIAEIDYPTEALELKPGDRLIVASDGLDTLSYGSILSFCDDASSPKECVAALLQGVSDANIPRQDNTTVVIIDVSEKEEAPVAAAKPIVAITDAPPQDTQPDAFQDAGESRSLALIGLVMLLLIGGISGTYWFVNRGSSDDRVDPDALNAIELEKESLDSITEELELDTTDDTNTAAEVSERATPEAIGTVTMEIGESFSDALKSGGSAPSMVWIAGGHFSMGSRDSAATFNERPQHTVNIGKFAISTHEVTIAQYNKFARANGRKAPKTGERDADSYPVFFVSWNDALAYTKWLSEQTGHAYRLPSEAEWEYAARAGSTTPYSWGRKLGRDNAHCFDCETDLDPRNPTRVGRFKANAFGIHDLAGNVEEWVYDCHHKNYAGAPNDGSVFAGGDCSKRVVRGGAFSNGPKALRSSARSSFRNDVGNDSIGIRIVRTP
jgi:formylglycine-generating enzyme required for sulfatase activity/serine/threonine protein phosphatase PrpC